MDYQIQIARIIEAAGQTFGQAKARLHLAKHEHAGIRGQRSAVEARHHGLAGNR